MEKEKKNKKKNKKHNRNEMTTIPTNETTPTKRTHLLVGFMKVAIATTDEPWLEGAWLGRFDEDDVNLGWWDSG